MKQVNDLLAKVRKLVQIKRTPTKRSLVSPVRDWTIMLVVIVVIVFSSSTWLGITYVRFHNLDNQITPAKTSLPNYEHQKVADMLSLYGARAAAYQAMPQATAPVGTSTIPTAASSTSMTGTSTVSAITGQMMSTTSSSTTSTTTTTTGTSTGQ